MTARFFAFATYAATVPAANWFIDNVGAEAFPGGPHTIPVGFGYAAPSGVLLIGVGLAARDAIHRLAGARVALAAIAVGVVLSVAVNPAVAVASGAAFLLGELADMGIYVPLAARGRKAGAVLASGVVGGAIDSFVFLWLAFGSVQFWQGQVIGKSLVATACAVAVGGWRAVSVRVNPLKARGASNV